MSSNSTTINNGQQLQVHTTLAKLFPYGYRERTYVYTSGGAVSIAAGTVMGVVKASGKVVPCVAANIATGDGYPKLILAQDIVLSGVATINVSCVFQGDVREDLLTFNGAETLDTVVGDNRMREWLMLMGINPIAADNNTAYENTIS